MTDHIKEVEGIVVGFMGYCSVRYSKDNNLAMSKEDIKQYKDVATAIVEAEGKEVDFLKEQIGRLANYIMANHSKEIDNNGACDVAIKIMRKHKKDIQGVLNVLEDIEYLEKTACDWDAGTKLKIVQAIKELGERYNEMDKK